MRNIFSAVNDLVTDGVIEKYALGGAMALLFYAEPASTYDIDIFVLIPNQKTLVDISPIYNALQQKGWKPEREHLMFDGIHVQFIFAPNKLVEESVEEALEMDYQGVPIRVISLEHLIAIMLQTGRPKDRERIGKLIEEDVKIDHTKLSHILSKYKLNEKWKKITNETD